MVTGVACGLQNRYGAFTRPGWVRFPHVPATSRLAVALAVGAIAVGPSAARAQDPAPPRPAAATPRATEADTVPPVSPLGALVRSMVIPGWGQLTVGRPARGAIYFAGEAASLYMVFKSHAKLSVARRAEPPNEDLIESRTQQRENWIVLAAFIAFLSGLDAWVSTNFWDFEPTIEVPPDGSLGVALGFALDIP